MRVLVVGAAGRVGRTVSQVLAQEHEVIAADIQPLDAPGAVRMDILDIPAVQEAVSQADAVVHLAIADGAPATGRETPEECAAALQVHAIGTYNLLRAAVDHGLKRFVYASSVSSVAGYPPHIMIGPEHRHLGGALYGTSKGFGEELCRMFGVRGSLSVAVLRLGNVYLEELAHIPRHPHCSRVHVEDVAQAFLLALRTERPPFCLVHIVGDNLGRQWDLETAKTLLGWQPRWRFDAEGKPHLP